MNNNTCANCIHFGTLKNSKGDVGQICLAPVTTEKLVSREAPKFPFVYEANANNTCELYTAPATQTTITGNGEFEISEITCGDTAKFSPALKIEWYIVEEESTSKKVTVEIVCNDGPKFKTVLTKNNPHPAGNLINGNHAGIEASVKNCVEFELNHSFFHDASDPNYNNLNWALYYHCKPHATITENA
jgi:hypothetical protein